MKATKGQLRNETWFLYFMEKQIKMIRLSKDKQKAKKVLLKSIEVFEKYTGKKL